MTVTVSIDCLPAAVVITSSPHRALVVPAGVILVLLLQRAGRDIRRHSDL